VRKEVEWWWEAGRKAGGEEDRKKGEQAERRWQGEAESIGRQAGMQQKERR